MTASQIPELSVADGMPPPGDLPHGELQATRLAGGSVRIDRADPRILISAELILAIFMSPTPTVELDLAGQAADPWPCWSGALLKITGANRRVVYRIGEYVPRVRAYIGEWPD